MWKSLTPLVRIVAILEEDAEGLDVETICRTVFWTVQEMAKKLFEVTLKAQITQIAMGHELPKGFIQEVIKSEKEVEKKKERVREEVQRRTQERVREEVQRRTQERAARSTNDALNATQSSYLQQ